jgi:hypothetical protein
MQSVAYTKGEKKGWIFTAELCCKADAYYQQLSNIGHFTSKDVAEIPHPLWIGWLLSHEFRTRTSKYI